MNEAVREAWWVAIKRTLRRAGLVAVGVVLLGTAAWLLLDPRAPARLARAACGPTPRPSACRAPVEAACGSLLRDLGPRRSPSDFVGSPDGAPEGSSRGTPGRATQAIPPEVRRACADAASDALGRAAAFWGGTAAAGWAAWQLLRRTGRWRARRLLAAALRPAPPMRSRDPAGAHERLLRQYGIPLPAEWWSEAAAAVLEYLEANREARGSKVRHDAQPGGLMTHTLSALIAAWSAVGELPEHLRRPAVVMLLAHDAGRVVARRDEEHDRLSAILAWRAMVADPDRDLRQAAPAVVATLLYRRYGVPYARELEPVVTLLLRVLRREGDAVEVARSVEAAMGFRAEPGAESRAGSPGPVPRPPEGFRIVEAAGTVPETPGPVAPPRGLRIVGSPAPPAETRPEPGDGDPGGDAVAAVMAASARERLKCVALVLGRRLFLCVPHQIYRPLVEAGRLDVEALAREGRLATAEDIRRAAAEAGVPCEVLDVPAEGPRLSVYIEGSVRGSTRRVETFFARALVFPDPRHPTVRQDAILVLPRRLEVIPDSGAEPARKRRDELVERMRAVGKTVKEATGHAGV
jgi:hypothetical protein